MVTLGTHDTPLYGRVLVEGVVTFKPTDFDVDVTKNEGSARFFVLDEEMTIAKETVAMSGPFYGLSSTTVDANRLKATSQQLQLEFYLLVNVGVDEGSAASAKKHLGTMNSPIVTALQDIDGSDGRTCKVGATTEYMCITVNSDGEMASEGLSPAVCRLNRRDGRQQRSISTYEGDSDQCGATSYSTQPRIQRIRHWSRGTVRTTYRHSFVLHVSLLVNRGYKPGNRRDGRGKRSTSTYEGNGNQCGATLYLPKAQPRTQRLWHWSRGTVRTTYRHSIALHVSLPVNRGYKSGNRNFIGAVSVLLFNRRQVMLSRVHIAVPAPSGCHVRVSELRHVRLQPYSDSTMKLLRGLVDESITSVSQRGHRQAAQGKWAEAELSLLEGSRRLASVSQWVPDLLTQVRLIQLEQCQRDVSGLLLADAADRTDMAGPVLLLLRSVGFHVGET